MKRKIGKIQKRMILAKLKSMKEEYKTGMISRSEYDSFRDRVFSDKRTVGEIIREDNESVLLSEMHNILISPSHIDITKMMKNSGHMKDDPPSVKVVALIDKKNDRHLFVAPASSSIHAKFRMKYIREIGIRVLEALTARAYFHKGKWYLDKDKKDDKKWSWVNKSLPYKDPKKIRWFLGEDLQFVKFKYDNYKHDKRPKVKVLDYEYPGIKGQSTYGKRKDLLAWNLNYYSNKKEAAKAIDDIDSFAKLLSANKEEKYKRIKHFFPAQAKLLRRYMRKHIKNIKVKKGMFWKRTNFNQLIKFDKESL